MAMANEVLGRAARHEQALQRRFGIVGGAPSPQLTPEITPVVPVVGGPEVLILADEFLYSGYTAIGAQAANYSVIQLRNPLNSGIVAVIEHLEAWNGSGADYIIAGIGYMASDLPGAAGAGAVTARDTRRPRITASIYTVLPVCRLTQDNTTPPTRFVANLFMRPVATTEVIQYNQTVILAPGFAIQLTPLNQNQPIFGAFAWREVPMAADEVGPF